MNENYLTISYNVTGSERKRLADCIAGFLGCERKYLGVPSCAFQVGYIKVSKDGDITFDDRADSEEIENLLEELEQAGFHADPVGAEEATEEAAETTADAETEEANPNPETEESSSDGNPLAETVGLTISVPADAVNMENLTKLLEAKGGLIKKALGISGLLIEKDGDKVSFPWFSEMPNTDEVQAYTHFISALCEMTKKAKRVTATEKEVDNEKYAFRCFLLRLGFIGNEHKADRKILLKNLSGNSSWKNGRKEDTDDEAAE